MRTLLVVLTLGVVLAVLGEPAAAASESYSFKGKSVYAVFVKDGDCKETVTAVFASKQKLDDNGDADGELTVVAIAQVDTCKGKTLISAYGTSDSPNLDVDKDLGKATLKDKVTVEDVLTGERYEVQVELEWDATGEEREVDTSIKVPTDDYTIEASVDGTSRPAEAKGEVSIGDDDYAKGASDKAAIMKLQEGTVTIS